MTTKLTQEMLEDLVKDVEFYRAEGSTLTVAVVELKNGCTVIGTSNVIDPTNFNDELGKETAVKNGVGKLWELEGYATKRENTGLVIAAAKAAHEANRVYCLSIGDDSILPWKDAPGWQRESAITGVQMLMANPETTPADSHESWFAYKEADGWVYGEEKDPDAKEHPCMVPYEELPEEQRFKDEMFVSVVRAVLNI